MTILLHTPGDHTEDPPEDMLREIFLDDVEAYWAAFPGDAGLHYRGPEGRAQVIFVFDAAHGFYVTYERDGMSDEDQLQRIDEGEGTVRLSVGGEPFEVPLRAFVPKEVAWCVVSCFMDRGAQLPAPKGFAWVPNKDDPADPVSTGKSEQVERPRRALRFIGAFQEFGHAEGPSIKAALGKRPAADAEAIANYLRRGQPIAIGFGLHRDVFDRSKNAGPLHILTDGTFAWHQALAYYVQIHGVEVPAQFEAHIRGLGFRCPDQIDVNELALPTERGES